MTTVNMPPDWAIEKALRRSGYQVTVPAEVKNGSMIHAREAIFAFARYIASHEDAPVDPLLVEARKLVSERYSQALNSDAIRATLAGEDDDTAAVQNCLIALRRGIELGKSS